MEDLLNTGTVSVKWFHLVQFDPHCNTESLVLLSPFFFYFIFFTDEGTGVQRDYVTCSKFKKKKVVEQRPRSGSPALPTMSPNPGTACFQRGLPLG